MNNDPLATYDLFGERVRPAAEAILKKRFLFPPFSVLDARSGDWQERKRAWLLLGIRSELGRGADAPTSASANAMELAGGFAARHGIAAPGGSARPACDYSKRERGAGNGRPIPGTAIDIVHEAPPPGAMEYRTRDDVSMQAGLTYSFFSADFTGYESMSGTSIFCGRI